MLDVSIKERVKTENWISYLDRTVGRAFLFVILIVATIIFFDVTFRKSVDVVLLAKGYVLLSVFVAVKGLLGWGTKISIAFWDKKK